MVLCQISVIQREGDWTIAYIKDLRWNNLGLQNTDVLEGV